MHEADVMLGELKRRRQAGIRNAAVRHQLGEVLHVSRLPPQLACAAQHVQQLDDPFRVPGSECVPAAVRACVTSPSANDGRRRISEPPPGEV
jgi:hypothetical protein